MIVEILSAARRVEGGAVKNDSRTWRVGELREFLLEVIRKESW